MQVALRVNPLFFVERYRSGHNGTDSKSVEPHGSVGSNPTRSARPVAGASCKRWAGLIPGTAKVVYCAACAMAGYLFVAQMFKSTT